MSTYVKIIVETHSKVRIIRFNQPKRKNAIDGLAYQEIARALNEANLDDNITTVAITGTGDYYSSGNDIKAAFEANMNSESREEGVEKSRSLVYNLVNAFICFEKLLIAVVNGPCLGIAFTTAALCDVVYCTKDVRS